jgi:5'-3' exonuclease, N-terminal resolvase-like domain
MPRSSRATACLTHITPSYEREVWHPCTFRPQSIIVLVEPIGNHPSRPLLVIDGDSSAHRAYHGLPKSIRRRGDRGGGAIVGFANFLLRLYENERARAVLVGWDTLDVPTYRHLAFPAYQSGRHFEAELREQLEVLPHFVAACGFAFAKAPGYEADDFLAAAVAYEERRGGTAIGLRGTVTLFSLPRNGRRFFSRCAPEK